MGLGNKKNIWLGCCAFALALLFAFAPPAVAQNQPGYTNNNSQRDNVRRTLVVDQELGATNGGALAGGDVNVLVDRHSVCRWLDNSSAEDYFVPTGSGADWQAFISNKPADVVVDGCCPAVNVVTLSTQDGSQTYDVGSASSPALDTGRQNDTGALGVQTLTHDFIMTRAEDGATWTETVTQTFTCDGTGVWTGSTPSYAGTEPPPAEGTWDYSGWGICSASCGGGTQSRTARCLVGSTEVDASRCSASPVLSQSCNTSACVPTCTGSQRLNDAGVCVSFSSSSTEVSAFSFPGRTFAFLRPNRNSQLVAPDGTADTGILMDYRVSAERLCVRNGYNKLIDWSGWGYTQGAFKEDADHDFFKFNSSSSDVNSMVVNEDSEDWGAMAGVLCAAENNILLPNVATTTAWTFNEAEAVAPSGFSTECPSDMVMPTSVTVARNSPAYFNTAPVTGYGNYSERHNVVNSAAEILGAAAASNNVPGVTCRQASKCYKKSVVASCKPEHQYTYTVLDWSSCDFMTGICTEPTEREEIGCRDSEGNPTSDPMYSVQTLECRFQPAACSSTPGECTSGTASALVTTPVDEFIGTHSWSCAGGEGDTASCSQSYDNTPVITCGPVEC